jgi:hypothetical protein
VTKREAFQKERARLRRIGLDRAYIAFCIAGYDFLTVSDKDPSAPPKHHTPRSKGFLRRGHYNTNSDTLWHYHDTSDPWESEDWRWTISITKASSNDYVLKYYKARAK